jgi:predicted transcriptional regulator
MPLKHYQAAAYFPGIKPIVRTVFLALAAHANESGECWPSIKTIADKCNISRPSAIHAIKELLDKGAIEAKKGKGRSNCSVYRILTEEAKGKAVLPFTGEKGKIHDDKRSNIALSTYNKDRTDKEQSSRNSRECVGADAGDLFEKTDIAEEPPKPARGKRKKRSPGPPDAFRKLTDTLTALWSEKYGGQKPKWRNCDFVNLRKHYGSMGHEEIIRRFRAFLEERGDFYAGHLLGIFVSQVDRWAKRAPAATAPAMPNFPPDELLD